MAEQGAALAGLAAYVPQPVLTNAELERRVETSDEWIRKRTGIVERRIAPAAEATSDLGAAAARRCLERAGASPDQVDGVVVSTCTPDFPVPSTASLVQNKLGIRRGIAFDLQAACCGFVYGLAVAEGLTARAGLRNVLLVCAETMTRIMDYQDRNTCILFGDGAAAVLVRPAQRGQVLAYYFDSQPDGWETIIIPAGGSACPAAAATVERREHYLKMEGKEVFRRAVEKVPELALEVVRRAGLTLDAVDWFVPHQANMRMLQAICQRLGVGMERCLVNLDRFGNTSAASLPLVLAEAAEAGKLQRGQRLLLCSFGAGLSFGGCLLEWA